MHHNMRTLKHDYSKCTANSQEGENSNHIIILVLKQIYNHLKQRRTLKELQSKSDAALKDIGIERSWLDRKLKQTPKTKFDDIGW